MLVKSGSVMKRTMLLALMLGVSNFMTSLAVAAVSENSFMFVENQVDNEYWVAPRKLDPRFSGANVFTKYPSRQDSLGYMQQSLNGMTTAQYLDLWLENSPINAPFVGNRCRNGSTNCPSSGVWVADHINSKGAFKIRQTSTVGESGNTRAIWSDNFYEYLRGLSINAPVTLQYNACRTRNEYNPSLGQTCASVGGTVREDQFTISKTTHVNLESTNALQELFIDSNGNPTIGLGSQLCTVGMVSNVNGAICKLVSYKLTGNEIIPQVDMYMKVNPIIGFTPSASSIRISGGQSGDAWYNYSTTTTDARNIIKPGGDGVYVFFSNVFLKDLITRGVDLTNSKDFFTFSFDSSVNPQSGFYEFSPSNTILLRPRDYGISIVDKDLVLNPTRTGKVGNTEPPIEFEYIVSTSGPRQANEITAQVTGPVHRSNRGVNYCLFSSPDNKIQVPFSAFLSYVDATGRTIKERNSCGDEPMDILPARWEETPWSNAPQEGSFFRTHLKLTFPMNESSSLFSLSGEDWIGVVRAQGEVRVKAIWRGNDVLP
ncbi:hypothetical protein AB8Q18_04560 [Neisseriaceae bacterium CLB008]